MKRIALILALVVLLSGCGAAMTYETLADEAILPVMGEPKEIWVSLPEDSVMPAMESEYGAIYLCEDFEVSVQTLEAGDLNATVQTISGYEAEDLTILQTGYGEIEKYEFVWTMAGEMGQRVGRATVLDDGSYHYCLCATIDAELISEYQEVWNGIFESFSLS